MTTFATRDWTTGEVVTASIANAQWRDNLNVLWVEVDAQMITSPVSVSTTTTVITSSTIVLDGTADCRLEFYAPYIALAATANATLTLNARDGINDIGQVYSAKSSSGGDQVPCHFFTRTRTPTAGSYTFSIVATQANGTQIIEAGAGSAAVERAYLRVWKRLN